MKLIALVLVVAGTLTSAAQCEARWPPLPAGNAAAEIPAQEWPRQPGPRTVAAYVYYPGTLQENIDGDTGLFLSLHNWGGTHAIGCPDPQVLADRYNVVAICVDYLQSGKDWDAIAPYDFGYLQALDALRALWWLYDGLNQAGISFNQGRIYSTGGSGGGNVTQMVNKLAPRTFAAIVDLCGMARLSDDIAYNLEGGSRLNAGYSKDPETPTYLSPDAQALRDLGNPVHLKQMKEYGQETQIFVVHGVADDVCPIEDKRVVVDNMTAAGLSVKAYYPDADDVTRGLVATTGHHLGDLTAIVAFMADGQLLAQSEQAAVRKGPADFERKDVICYVSPNGCWEISYEAGYPVGRMRTE